MKGKRELISLTVAVLVVGLMVGLLFWQRNREVEAEEVPYSPLQSIRLVERMEDEVTRVVFQGQDFTTVMLPFEDENGNIQWMYEGADYQLSLVETRNKVRPAHNIFSSQIIHEDINEVPGLNLDDFGFNQVVMTAYYADGTSLNLYLGGPTADFRGHFLMVEGDPGLYVVAMANVRRFKTGLEDLLDTFLPIWDTEAMYYLLIAERDREPVELSLQEYYEIPGVFLLEMQQPFQGREVFPSGFNYRVMEAFSGFALGDLVSLHPTDFSAYGLDYPSLELVYNSFHGNAHLLFGDVFFRDEGGGDTAFIYVKFADRPHVFEALYAPASAIFNVNVLQFIERFVALIDIQTVERIDITSRGESHVMYINHAEGDSTAIEPTINGIEVGESDFRMLYRLLIGLGINSEIEPFTPEDEPIHTVLYTRINEDDVSLRFYAYDDHFLAVSVDGAEIWFVVTQRSVDLILSHMEDLLQ